MNISLCCSANSSVFMCRSPPKNVTDEFVPASPAVPCIFCLSNLWLYSSYFIGCCFQDLYKIAHSILVQFPSSFFSKHFVKVQMVQPYSSIGTTTAWKNSCFISSKKSDFYIVNKLSIAAHTFSMFILTLLSVHKILLPKYMNASTNFRGLSFNVKMAPFWLKHEFYFMWVHIETNFTFCLLQAIQQRNGLSSCICEKHKIIHIVLYSHNQPYIHICMQKHIQHNKDKRTQFFRKIYLSLYLKGFERVTKGFTVWEVSWRLNRTATYWPPLLWP